MDDAQASVSRRALLTGIIAAIGAADALAGCGIPSGTPHPQPSPNPRWQPGTTVARANKVEVGGGLIVPDRNVVVTQPTAGAFKAFSAICTHAGCTVATAEGGAINCPCHNWKFSIADGSVMKPAGKDKRFSLPEAEITVKGDTIEFT